MTTRFVCMLICLSGLGLGTLSGAVVKVVKTPTQLMDAVLAGETHVHITEHMDLRGVTPQYQERAETKLIHAPESLASLSVRTRHVSRQSRSRFFRTGEINLRCVVLCWILSIQHTRLDRKSYPKDFR